MADPYAIPTLLLLLTVTGMFYALHRRQRQIITLLMFLAWTGFSMRLALTSLLMLLPGMAGGVYTALSITSDCALVSAVLVLNAALTSERFGDRPWMRYGITALLPVNILILAGSIAPVTALRQGIGTISFVALLCVFLRWNLVSAGLMRYAGLVLTAVNAALGARYLLARDYDALETLLLATSLYYAAFAFAKYSARRTAGSLLVVSGLSGWATIFTVALLVPLTPSHLSLLDRASDLLKILTAIGLVIHLLEEETRRSADARLRERRLRNELERYSAIDLTPIPLVSHDPVFHEVCTAVCSNSPFRQCALLLRAVSGSTIAAACGGPAPHADTLRSITRDLDAGVKLPGPDPLLGSLAPYTLQDPDGTPVAGYLLPLLSQVGVVQGCLWLASPRVPTSELTHDLLLPLESLAARVSAALENRALTQRLIRADRLAGLGKLAGGIAHELNNPLTIVRGYAELIEDATSDAHIRKQAGHILSEAERMKRIVADMSQFWRTAGPDYAPVDCAELLRSVEKMHGRDVGKQGIQLTVNILDDLPPVMGSRDSLTQVVVQVMQNAVHAIEQAREKPRSPTESPADSNGHNGSGAQTSHPAIRSHAAQEHRIRIDGSRTGSRIHIMISDTGTGFADPERAFDPFYTTREPGEGTGLGLSVCYGLVRQHRGDISAVNLLPHGAAVVIDLPIAPTEVLEQAGMPTEVTTTS